MNRTTKIDSQKNKTILGTIYERTLKILKTIIVNLVVNYSQFRDNIFVFALMKSSYAAFGEQNKIYDSD